MKENKIKSPVTKGVAKVPVIMQLEALECGAASLAMVVAYYDKWIPLEQVRSDCGVSRDGSNAKNIAKAAIAYGFKVEAFRRNPQSIREKGVFPCIIHWDFNHFVVLCGFKGKYACINDPARGNIQVSPEEFDESFTGVTIQITPGKDFAPSGRRSSTLSFAKKRLTGAKAAMAFVTLTTVISALFGILNPMMSKIFMDRLLTGRNHEWLMPFIRVMVALAALQLIAEWIKAIYSLKLGSKLAILGSTSYMWKVLHLPMEFFSQRMAGDIQSRQATNANIAGTLVNTLAPLVIHTVLMILYLALMLRQSLLLTAFSVTVLTINLFLSKIISEKRINNTRVKIRDTSKLSSATSAGIEMIETIKASGAENGYFQKWAGYQASLNAQEVKAVKMDSYLGSVPAFLTGLANYAVLVIGVWLILNGRFTLGALQMFQGLLGAFMEPAMMLIRAGQTLQEMRTQMERVEDVMQYRDDPNTTESEEHGETITKLRGHVELRNVTFGYSHLAEPIITDFSMDIPSGGRVAFVGTSGCGKSTLSKLISGLYTPWSGEILFDGKPRESYDRAVMTGSLAVVDQDITLFEGSIADNIKMWDESVQDFEMILAARDARLHDVIMARVGGYDAPLNAGGTDLSGGQRQRMEIARVLAQDPSLVILDEATSALDAKTEYDVVKAIKDRGITCIVIAHRLSTIRDCDEIIVMQRGKVVERGTHETLMQLGGLYTELVMSE